MTNPYAITGPALISFSGGRTSAFMLRQILDAHDGALPDDVHVCFANTGKEREETLRFVYECGSRWGVEIAWLEWRPVEEVEARFERVGFNSADRSGVWFEKLIERHNVLPNPLVRYCTKDLKIRTLHRYMRSLGHTSFLDVVGLRADEMHRVERLANSTEAKRAFAPMAAAGHTENDVLKFWREQPFDLGLQGFEGNCDLCFLKRRETLKRIIREGRADPTWWIKMEATKKVSPDGAGHLFRETTTFAEIARDAHGSPMLPMFDDGDEHDVECGLACDLGYDPAADVERAIAFAKDHPYRPPQ